MVVQSIIINLTWRVSKFISKISKPEPRVSDKNFKIIKNEIKNGDVLVSRVEWELSNVAEKILTGSFWGHAAIYFDGWVYEATTKGVRKISLEMFCFRKDSLGLGRLQGSDWTDDQCSLMISFLNDQLGDSYDFSFSWGIEKKWYCSKLVFFAWDQAKAEEAEAIDSMNTFGLKKVTPQNIWDSVVQVVSCIN
jgi:uncharacterized protein YycO